MSNVQTNSDCFECRNQCGQNGEFVSQNAVSVLRFSGFKTLLPLDFKVTFGFRNTSIPTIAETYFLTC